MLTDHELCERARAVRCACGAPPGEPCQCGPGDFHVARFTRARAAGLIEDLDDIAYIIHNHLRVVHDPAVTP